MYKPIYQGRVLSPIQPARIHPAEKMRRSAMDTQNAEHPVRREIQKLCGKHQFTAVFSENTTALKTFPNVLGLVSVRCLLSNSDDGEPAAEGFGYAILTRINKSIERTAFICLNASFLSACNNFCKTWDASRLDSMDERKVSPNKMLGEAYQSTESNASDGATPKQIEYLRQLVAVNFDSKERDRWEDQISSFTREDASEAIQSLTRNR